MTQGQETTHQRRIGRSPMRVSVAGLCCIVAAVLAMSMAAAAASPLPTDATRVAIGAGGAVAAGPFGDVAGIPLVPGSPLPEPARLDALDAYGRGARVSVSPVTGSFDQWRVTALREPSLDPSTVEELGSGSSADTATFRLPSTGLFLVRLDGTVVEPTATGPGTAGTWLWRIAVPDRDVPGDGDPYPPMPAITLASGDHAVDLDPGSGCFVGTCGDIGATSPPRTLPTIRSLAGAPLRVRLSDGSDITAWSADATPVGAGDDATVPLSSGSVEAGTHTLAFAAPSPGRWVILVHVRFDRERGASDGYGRLILE